MILRTTAACSGRDDKGRNTLTLYHPNTYLLLVEVLDLVATGFCLPAVDFLEPDAPFDLVDPTANFFGVTLEGDVFFFAAAGLALDFLGAGADDADFLAEVADFALVFTEDSVADLALAGATFLSLATLLIVFDGALDADLLAGLAAVFPFVLEVRVFLSATDDLLSILDLVALDFVVGVDLGEDLGLVDFTLLIGLFSFDEPLLGANLTLPEGPLGNVKVPLEAPVLMERLS